MSSFRDKKVAPPQEEGSPAWMNTYGDMVTLLLTFFVLLFSFSTIDVQKWKDIVNSFAGQQIISAIPDPGNTGNSTSGPGDLEEWLNSLGDGEDSPGESDASGEGDEGEDTTGAGATELTFVELYEEIKEHIETHGLESMLGLSKNGDVITLRISDSALFDSGQADIKDESLELLAQVGAIFAKYQASIQMIRIEGHTDNVPISRFNTKYKDNWDLSTSRAGSVLRYFIETSDLEQNQFSVMGYGEFYPVASNDTEEGRAQNRRVDFVIQSYAVDNAGGN